MRQRKSHASSKAIPSLMSAKLRDNQLSIYSMFFADMGWSLKETTVCSQRAEWSTRIELSCWLSSWREIQSTLELCEETSEVPVSKLIDDYGSQDCGRFCNVIDTNGSVHFLIFSTAEPHAKLCTRLLRHPCKPRGIQQVSSLRRTHDNIKWQQRNISQFTSFL